MSAAPDPALDGAYGPVRRKEDARFLRGQGTFVDDIQRPGMLHGAILRSPLAHARIVSVDTAAAEAHPRVRAVITGELLEQRKLAWMPTLSRDVQAVLATDKVRFQGQEVAFVVAEDRYSARDALELIQVEYEPLPVVVDATRALDPGAPLIRDDVAGQQDNHIFDWDGRRPGRHRRGLRRRGRGRHPGHAVPALAPRAAGDLRRGGRDGPGHREAHGVGHHAGAARAPHPVRADRRAARAQDPDRVPGHRRRVRQQGPGVPGLPVCRGRHHADRPAGEVGRGPVGEPDVHRVRPGLPHARRDRRDPGRADPRPAGPGAGRPRRVQRVRPAQQVPGRVLPHLHRLLRPAGGPLRGHRRLHQQGPRRGGLLLLVPDRRGRVPGRADGQPAGRRARPGPGRAADAEPAAARAVPLHLPDRVGVRLRRLPPGPAGRDGPGRVPGTAAGAGGEAGPRRVHGHRAELLHRGGRRRAAQGHGHPRPGHGRRRGPADLPDRRGGAEHFLPDPGPGARDHLRPDRRA